MSKPQNYKLMLVASGQEVLSEVIEEESTETELMLKRPVILHASINETTNQMNIGFIPFIPYLRKETVLVNRTTLVYCEEAPEDLVKGYKEAMGEKTIVTPPKKGLILPGQ